MRLVERLIREGPTPPVRIVHFGPGAFFRSFIGIHTQDANDASGDHWGILGVSLQSGSVRDQLEPQGGLYTAMELGPDGPATRIVDAVAGVIVAPEAPGAVIRAMADARVSIVSLTITEKGYCHAASSGRLDLAHPDIARDLASPDTPRTAPGLITAALRARRLAGVPPFTVLSCDNLSANGRLARRVVLDFAGAIDPDLALWIEREVAFPSTMVDRITPATSEADLARLRDLTGYSDPALVVHEPFSQWVIEDDFPAGRPAWHLAGARMVSDVGPHETMKLRCLNGTHSALAYLGFLAGQDTIAETVADPDFAAYCEHLWKHEILPTVAAPEGEDLDRYCDALMERYRNPAIRHRTAQIAMDGSQKLPQRILGTCGDNLRDGRTPHGLCLAVAAWMRYVGGVDEDGAPIEVRDPMAARLKAASDAETSAEGKVRALLSIREVFEPALSEHPRFSGAVAQAYKRLSSDGARRCVARHVREGPASA